MDSGGHSRRYQSNSNSAWSAREQGIFPFNDTRFHRRQQHQQGQQAGYHSNYSNYSNIRLLQQQEQQQQQQQPLFHPQQEVNNFLGASSSSSIASYPSSSCASTISSVTVVKKNEDEKKQAETLRFGQHVHHQLEFLRNSSDFAGVLHRNGGSASSLKIDLRELAIKFGSLSSIHLYYWAFKEDYFHAILFIQSGSFFYSLHNDADVLVKELRLKYQGGMIARCCFSSTNVDKYLNALVNKGYRVGVIRETIQPECECYETLKRINNCNVFIIDNDKYREWKLGRKGS